MAQIIQIWKCIKCKTTTTTVAVDRAYEESYCSACGEKRVVT